MLKIIGEITLGENADGELAFNSRNPSERWITLAVQDAHALVVKAVHAGYLLRDGAHRRELAAGTTIYAGTGLQLPANSLCVSQTLQPGGIERQLILQPQPQPQPQPRAVQTPRPAAKAAVAMGSPSKSRSPAAVPKQLAKSSSKPKPPAKTSTHQSVDFDARVPLLDDIVVEVDPVPLPKREPSTLQTAPAARGKLRPSPKPILTPALLQQPTKGAHAYAARRSKANSAAANAPRKPEAGRKAAPKKRRYRSGWWALFLLVLIAGGLYGSIQGRKTPSEPEVIIRVPKVTLGNPSAVSFPSKPRSALSQAIPEPQAEAPQPASADRSDAVAVNPPPSADTVAVNPQPATSMAGAAAGDAADAAAQGAVTLDLAALEQQARSLLDQGYVTWPERNGVSIIQTMLVHSPEHAGALAMRDEAAGYLTDQATRAIEDGFAGSAAVLLDEVLSFAPDYLPAQRLRATL